MPLYVWSKCLRSAAPIGRYRRAPRVLSTSQAGEVTLFDPRGGRYYTLNDVGSRVWALVAEGATLAAIVEVIRREYAVPDDPDGSLVQRDIARLLGEMRVAGLVIAEPDERWTEVVGRGEQPHESANRGS